MTTYKVTRWDMVVLALCTWALSTGLAGEKVWKDGVTSWTMLLSMPVLTGAVAVLIHQFVEKDAALLKRAAAAILACLCLAVILPASIGSSGGARDAALAEAAATNRSIQIAQESYSDIKRDISSAKAGVERECEGAPEVINDNSWPRCRWWRRQLKAHELAMSKVGEEVKVAPVEKVADSGEKRVAWLLSAVASNWGYRIQSADVALVWPMLPPIVFELLCAFFLTAGIERRRVEAKAVDQNILSEEVMPEKPLITAAEPVSTNSPSDPRPRKRTKRQQKRERGVEWVRKYRAKHGRAPALEVVSNVLKVPQTTAHRWRKLAA